MKKYQKLTACVLAVAVSAGVTGTLSYNNRKNTSAIHTDALPAEETAAEAPAERIAADGDLFKDETVYVLCNSDASVRDIIVSDWLKNPGALQQITDASGLTDIENVKGTEGFTQSGEGLTWDAAGSDIYYKGKSSNDLPVTVQMTYTLDGRQVDPDAITGQSGHLVIEWRYTNHTETTRTVNGKRTKMYVPFMTASTAILD
ncbi:MAG: hypothetical protein IJV58_04205, partial [Oscillospiraceae bacterium]|nr:hypothetical protein [Oscillospiraceae bacterium]